MQFTTYTVLALAAAVSAKQISIKVGDGGLNYAPNDFTAEVGDEVVFSYFPKNHTVTQSSFAKPCVPLAGGFFSGFVPTASGMSEKTFTIKVTTTDPIWFYCSQPVGGHCRAGMVGGINIKQQSKNTLAAFKTLAAATNGTITDLVPAGGAVSSNIAVPPPSNSTSASGTGKSTSSVVTTAVVSTAGTSTATAPYTTNGVTYTSGQAVPYSTVYTTTSTSASVVDAPTASTSAPASTSSAANANAAPGSLSGGLFAGAAAVLCALAMI